MGWGKYHDFQRAEEMLDALLYAVVAEDHSTGKVVGCALLPGDKASLFYVKDVMVDPGYQRKHIGSAMMEMITAWLDEHAPENAFVTLVTPENLAPFYQQFDFSPVFAVHRSIKSKSKDTAE